MADLTGVSANALQPAPASGIEGHPIQFTGRGGEYFRVWLVNVLLTIVTLSIYTPWARRRTAQYFYGHTHVVGSPLEFVAEQRRMVFGYLAFVALFLAYQLAKETGQQLAAAAMFFGFAALLPFLWGSAMRFRLGATRWRGIRLAFTASWKEVYLASWPVFAIALVWTVAVFLAFHVLRTNGVLGRLLPGVSQVFESAGVLLAVAATAVVLSFLLVIRLEFNYKRLLVARSRIGGQLGHWKPSYRAFVKVWLAAAGLFIAIVLAAGLVGALLFSEHYLPSKQSLGIRNIMDMLMLMVAMVVFGFFFTFLASLPARAYREARMFQLVWNNVGFGNVARTRTNLRTGAFVWLRIKNLLLTVLTLGFYRPFAVNSEYAAKVGSVTIFTRGSVDQLVGDLVQQQGALGDAAADVIGLDLIG